MAAKKFNMKPKLGIKYLVEKGFLSEEPQPAFIAGIVKFLKTTPALSPTAIGQYLGENKDHNKEVLEHYINEYDWTSPEVDFVSAMKQMMSGVQWDVRSPASEEASAEAEKKGKGKKKKKKARVAEDADEEEVPKKKKKLRKSDGEKVAKKKKKVRRDDDDEF